jgi:threonyl-tRNA synthetase
MAFLIEHYAGAFPVWLAPVQVTVIPVADRHLEYAHQIEAELRNEGVRVKVDERSERMNLKIRQAQLEKVPYMLVIGDKEIASATVSVRLRTGEQLPSQTIGDFKSSIKRIIAERAGELHL